MSKTTTPSTKAAKPAATKGTGTKAAATTPTQQAKSAAAPMTQMVAALAAPTQPAAPATVAGAPATPVLPVAVVVAGQQVSAAKNVLARAASLGNIPTELAAKRLALGPVLCGVRVPYTVQCWLAVQAALAAAGGTATGAALAGASTGDFVRYAVKNRWLAPVQA